MIAAYELRKPVVTLACCSDTHGAVPPPLRGGSIAAWLHAGDVYDGSDSERRAEELQAWLVEQKVPVLAVRGNHDVNDVAGFLPPANDITGAVKRVTEGLWVAGIGWHGSQYDEVPNQNEMDDLCVTLHQRIVQDVGINDRLIIVTHYPADVPDASNWPAAGEGYPAIGHLIAAVHPIAVIQGHVHEWFGVVRETFIDGYRCLVLHSGPTGMLLYVESETGRAWVQGEE